MKKNTIHQIYKFWSRSRIKKAATAIEEIKTVVAIGKMIVAIVKTADTVEKKITAAIETAAITKIVV